MCYAQIERRTQLAWEEPQIGMYQTYDINDRTNLSASTFQLITLKERS
jgi:hypothetical protein